ncbi:MAG: LysE family translocator [Granulosicoccus sp.]|nr:LysE family translocator [Granulosicoccus sp.]
MPPYETLAAFLLATLIFAYLPGPALLYTAAQTVARGRRAGIMAAAGLHVGGYVHVVAAAAGLSTLFHAVPTLYFAVKLVGAVYLVFLGVQMIWRAVSSANNSTESAETVVKSGRKAFAESAMVEILNPKTAMFFIAFLPQFVVASDGFPVWVQFLILGTVVNLTFSSADLVCVYFAGMVVDRLRKSSRIAKSMEFLGGSILVGLGLHMIRQRS